MKTVIIIPARMASKRFPNKPMALIDGIPMIQRVWKQAIESNLGDTFVACSEKEVFELISNLGGNAIMTDPSLPSGTDRVYSALKQIQNYKSYESIINLQGDMPLIYPEKIIKINNLLIEGFDIGTLATNLTIKEEENVNITKIKVTWTKKNDIGQAEDFYKNSKGIVRNICQHVGIYSYKLESLIKFVSMSPSLNEQKFNLEQFRALDAKMSIGVSYVENFPISVDTKEDLINIENIIKNKR